MALAISATDTEAQKPVNVIYQQLLLENARPLCPYFVGTTPGQISEGAGTATIKWRRYNTSADNSSGIAPSLTALSELTGNAAYGQARDSSAVHFTDVTATVSKYGQYYILNEEVDVFLPNGTMAGISATLGITAGRLFNQLQRNIAEDNLTQRFAANVASKGLVNSITVAGGLDRIINEITSNYGMPFSPMTTGSTNIGTVPTLPALWAICHPHQAYDISNISGFKSVETYAGQVATMPGEIGLYPRAGLAVRFVQTAEASIDADAGTSGGTDVRSTSGTNADLYTLVVYGQNCLGSVGVGTMHGDGIYRAGDERAAIRMMASDPPNTKPSPGDPYAELMVLSFKGWHSGAVLNANWGRALVTAATNLNN